MWVRFCFTVLVCSALFACEKAEESAPKPPLAPNAAASPTEAAPPAAAIPGPPAAQQRAAGGPRKVATSPSTKSQIVSGLAAGPAAQVIADEVALANGAGKCIVYVGAPWCQPCQRFKRALLAGELDAELINVRFLEFDADLDKQRLADAGYKFQLVPFFGRPGFDGRATSRTTSGVPAKDSPMAPLAKRVAALLRD